MENYVDNDEVIENHNKKASSYVMGHNKYSDSSYAENKRVRTGLKFPPSILLSTTKKSVKWVFGDTPSTLPTVAPRIELPASVNFTSKMQVVRDQFGKKISYC